MSIHHVLIVEDDPVTAVIAKAVVASLPVSSTVVTTMAEALAYLMGRPPYHLNPFPSLVLLDLGLPDGSGFEILEWMAAGRLLSVAPVIVVSSAEEDARRRALRMGARACLTKPLVPRELLRALQAYLAQTQPHHGAHDGSTP